MSIANDRETAVVVGGVFLAENMPYLTVSVFIEVCVEMNRCSLMYGMSY